MRELDKLLRDAKEIETEFEEYRRHSIRLARKARQFANRVRKQYPDMRLVEDLREEGLHEHAENLAQALYTSNNPHRDDPAYHIGTCFRSLFRFIKRLSDVPWLNPTD